MKFFITKWRKYYFNSALRLDWANMTSCTTKRKISVDSLIQIEQNPGVSRCYSRTQKITFLNICTSFISWTCRGNWGFHEKSISTSHLTPSARFYVQHKKNYILCFLISIIFWVKRDIPSSAKRKLSQPMQWSKNCKDSIHSSHDPFWDLEDLTIFDHCDDYHKLS